MAGIARKASEARPANLRVMFWHARGVLYMHLLDLLIVGSGGNASCRRSLLVCSLAVARFLRQTITVDQFVAIVTRTVTRALSSRYRCELAEVTHKFRETLRALQWRCRPRQAAEIDSLMRDIIHSPVLDCHRGFLCSHPELAPYRATVGPSIASRD